MTATVGRTSRDRHNTWNLGTGANIRAYHFLCFQTQIGYRQNDPITLTEVEEVIPMVIQQGWLTPETRGTYDKYLSGGNLHLITDDFRGKGRLKALWDITGYALQEGMWTNPTTTEMYLQQLAAFWSMMAPKEPTLPGVGGDGTLYKQFDTPQHFWNSKYIETLQVKRIILDAEDKDASASAKIVPKAVSKGSGYCPAELGSCIGRLRTCICMVDSL